MQSNSVTVTHMKTFNIETISVPIVYNRYGDHDPNQPPLGILNPDEDYCEPDVIFDLPMDGVIWPEPSNARH